MMLVLGIILLFLALIFAGLAGRYWSESEETSAFYLMIMNVAFIGGLMISMSEAQDLGAIRHYKGEIQVEKIDEMNTRWEVKTKE